MFILPEVEETETISRTYKYTATRVDGEIEACSVCGKKARHPYRQIQYHKSLESGHWIMDFAIFGHGICLKKQRRGSLGMTDSQYYCEKCDQVFEYRYPEQHGCEQCNTTIQDNNIAEVD